MTRIGEQTFHDDRKAPAQAGVFSCSPRHSRDVMDVSPRSDSLVVVVDPVNGDLDGLVLDGLVVDLVHETGPQVGGLVLRTDGVEPVVVEVRRHEAVPRHA